MPLEDVPTIPRNCYTREQLPGAINDRRAEVRAYWERYPDVARFLADHMPFVWDQVSKCRLTYKEDLLRGSKRGFILPKESHYILTPYSCHKIPWCILCVRAGNARRAMESLNAFARCTPVGQDHRFIGIVQTVQVRDDESGWGRGAVRNPNVFLRAVANHLDESYGPGLGFRISFQAFGERGPKKWHPHADLTINGYAIVDGNATPIPPYDLTNGGRLRWHNDFIRHFQKAFPDSGPINTRPGRSMHMLEPRLGALRYYPIMRYKVREMVDLRKILYNREKQTIMWTDYTTGATTLYTVQEFMHGILRYQEMYGAWTQKANSKLHVPFGHMSKRLINRTEADVGGAELPHGKDCPCHHCNDLERVFLDDVDQEAGQAGRIRV